MSAKRVYQVRKLTMPVGCEGVQAMGVAGAVEKEGGVIKCSRAGWLQP